ncbi:Uncharacterised protein [Mycobacteroides abscessus subsp. abscessus]|nr:Uncharacterised protein [Mycobacteroides abscessus subsp. abscessus]
MFNLIFWKTIGYIIIYFDFLSNFRSNHFIVSSQKYNLNTFFLKTSYCFDCLIPNFIRKRNVSNNFIAFRHKNRRIFFNCFTKIIIFIRVPTKCTWFPYFNCSFSNTLSCYFLHRF